MQVRSVRFLYENNASVFYQRLSSPLAASAVHAELVAQVIYQSAD